MDRDLSPSGAAGAPADRRRLVPTSVAGFAACAFIAAANSPAEGGGPAPALVSHYGGLGGGVHWSASTFAPLVAVIVAVALVRRYWPYLLLAGALIGLPALLHSTGLLHVRLPVALYYHAPAAGLALVTIGVLGCAQELVQAGAVGWGTAVAGCTYGAQLFGAAQIGAGWSVMDPGSKWWHLGMAAFGLGGAILAVSRHSRGAGEPPPGPPAGSARRLVVAGALATAIPLLLDPFTEERVAGLLGVSQSALYRHGFVTVGIAGLFALMVAVTAAAVAGIWSLGGALTAALGQVALAAPMLLALSSLEFNRPGRWIAALIGVVIGVVAAVSRWRIPLAAGGAVLSATAMFVAFAATTGDPEKLVEQRAIVPGLLLVVLLTASGTALVGGAGLTLARRGAAPAVLGPIVAALAIGGRQVLGVTYVDSQGSPGFSFLDPVHHLTTSATLLLVAAAALAALAFAEVLARRRAERKRIEAVQREAAEAERNRLARPIHDGVLQVLALMQRHGPELGGRGAELAELAGAQELALRALITTEATPAGRRTTMDLRTLLTSLAGPAVDVSAPADPVVLPAHTAREIYAAVTAALDNVRRHAGPQARAWVLVEREPDGVRVTVRDDGPGLPAGRLDEAVAAGRLGVAQSMRGRIGDLGGDAVITSAPGEGTEVEFWIPAG